MPEQREGDRIVNTMIVATIMVIICFILAFSPHSPLYAQSAPKLVSVRLIASDKLADSARRADRMQRVLAHMDYLEKYKSDRNTFCHHLLDAYESIEMDASERLDQYGPVDKSPDWHRDLLVDASKFLRYDCWDKFGKDKMGDGRLYMAYQRASLLVWTMQ